VQRSIRWSLAEALAVCYMNLAVVTWSTSLALAAEQERLTITAHFPLVDGVRQCLLYQR
jgi:hypothetical protein